MASKKRQATNKDAVASYHHGDLKASLIQTANDLLREKGVAGLSLRGIAAKAGVSHAAPYSHFKNKNELLRAVMDDAFDRLADEMEASKSTLTQSGEIVLGYGTAYLHFALENPELYRLMLGHVDSLESNFTITSERPFLLLHDAFLKTGRGEAYAKSQAIGAWSLVHGMAALIIGGHVEKPKPNNLKAYLRATMPLY